MAHPTKNSMMFHLFLLLMLLLILIGVGLMVYGSMHNALPTPTLPGNFNLARLLHV